MKINGLGSSFLILKYLSTFLLLILTLITSPALAKGTKIVILGPEFPGLVEPDGSGLYQTHIRKVLTKSDIEMQLKKSRLK